MTQWRPVNKIRFAVTKPGHALKNIQCNIKHVQHGENYEWKVKQTKQFYALNIRLFFWCK